MTRATLILLALAPAAFAGDLPPAPVGPSSGERAEIEKLIGELGHSDFAVRDGAFRRLGEFEGKAYRSLLTAETTSPDAEVRHRCGLLIPAARGADLNARLTAYLADTKGEFAHDLPGLAPYAAATRDLPNAREIFTEMVRDPGTFRLLQVVESDPLSIPAAVLARATELQLRQGRPAVNAPPGLVVRPVVVARPAAVPNDPASQAGLAELLGLYFVDTLAPKDAPPRRPGTGPTTFLYQPVIRNAMAPAEPKDPAVAARNRVARAVLAQWFETREEAYELNVAISYAGQFDMPDVAVRAATKQLANKAAQAHMRGQAVGTLAKFAKEKAIPTLESLLTDTTQAGSRFEQETNDDGQVVNKQYPILTKDVALAMLIHLKGQKISDYGMRSFAINETLKFQYSNHWFRSDADRDAAFKKYTEERAKEKKKEKE
jgi:hypothetical protein